MTPYLNAKFRGEGFRQARLHRPVSAKIEIRTRQSARNCTGISFNRRRCEPGPRSESADTFRHSWSSLLVANGENVEAAQELMRHASSRFAHAPQLTRIAFTSQVEVGSFLVYISCDFQ